MFGFILINMGKNSIDKSQKKFINKKKISIILFFIVQAVLCFDYIPCFI